MRAARFTAYVLNLQSHLKKLYATKNPVMVKNAFTRIPPVMNQNCSVPVIVQKCAIIKDRANRYLRKSKQFSPLTNFMMSLFISIYFASILLFCTTKDWNNNPTCTD